MEQLPRLKPSELSEIHERIWQLEEEELLSGRARPSDDGKALLDAELEDYLRNPDAGSSWEEVETRLKQ